MENKSRPQFNKLLKNLTAFLGFTSIVGFLYGYLIFESLRPKMVRFQEISPCQKDLIDYFGFGLLAFLGFCLLSLFRLALHLKKAKKISLLHLGLLASGILGLLFVFGDIALLSDIGKQYEHGLAQPEWLVLYLLMVLQLSFALILTWANLSKLKAKSQLEHVAKDSNVFLIAQYVGVICGGMGLAFVFLNFFFPRPFWMIKAHTTITTIFFLVPYLLIVGFWLAVKFQEKSKQWYNEKQVLDVGRSSFLTLTLSVVIMSLLYLINYRWPEGLLSVLWLPFYLFLVLLLFSLNNLYFSQKS